MRAIEKQICDVIDNAEGWEYKLSPRDRVTVSMDRISSEPKHDRIVSVYLWDTEIAHITFAENETRLYIRNGGFYTTTTKGRLNAILRHFNQGAIVQKNFDWYLNGQPFAGEASLKF